VCRSAHESTTESSKLFKRPDRVPNSVFTAGGTPPSVRQRRSLLVLLPVRSRLPAYHWAQLRPWGQLVLGSFRGSESDLFVSEASTWLIVYQPHHLVILESALSWLNPSRKRVAPNCERPVATTSKHSSQNLTVAADQLIHSGRSRGAAIQAVSALFEVLYNSSCVNVCTWYNHQGLLASFRQLAIVERNKST
jgi:hypothetical protein